MTSRDDMVIRPRLGGEQAAAPVRAREERRVSGTRGKRGLGRKIARIRRLHRKAQIRRARSSRRGLNAAQGSRMAGRVAASGARGAGGAIANAGKRAAATPIGALVAVGVVAAAVVTRLASGRSFENLGQQVNNILLGDMDDEARASASVRKRLGGDSDIARIIGREGKVNSQIASLHKDLKKLALRDEIGASMLRSEEGMQHNGLFDMLIIRGRDAFLKAWNGGGGPAATEKFRGKYRETVQASGKAGAR